MRFVSTSRHGFLNQKYLTRSDSAFYAMSYFVFTSIKNFVSIIKVN